MSHRSTAVALACALAACSESPGPVGASSVSLTPSWLAVATGDSAALTAVAVGPHGDTLPAPALTWSSSNPAVAQVDSGGFVHGLALGSARIRVTYHGRSDSAEVAVLPPVLVGAGDIADCLRTADSATATLLDTIPGLVFTAGDNAYPNGTLAEYTLCYDPTWGRHKNRTRPSPGNHEYHSLGVGYYAYFGQLAGDSGVGYYSYDFAGWHIISLNSSVPMGAGSAQEQWLRADLARHPAPCTLAYWHHPRFSSGTTHGSNTSVRPLWQALYEAQAEVVVSAHEHHYERFAPQQPDGTADPTNGLREFVVGTGGANRYAFGTPIANSEVRNNTSYGVIKLTLNPTGYAWKYITTTGAVADSGSGACH
jgi:hypothetical protein